jgi:hypothetical protein
VTDQTIGPNPPPRRALLKEFCRATHWRNRRGELCLASANVCLNRLEAQGRVRLPPPEPRRPPPQPRRLRDDGAPLPPAPKLPRSVEQIPDLHLTLLRDAGDPDHELWNRLVSRLHPLQGAPLFGRQLRYLIWSGTQVIGAFGFGPAAFHLACRDTWIGWDAQAQAQNRELVIGLSRFLIRPEVHCRNLASQCYGLVLPRVRQDWEARYGLRPLLVETYVDRSTHTGKSLAAANWLRLGQSQGRGRSSPRRNVRPKTVKDVWVWQWDRQARQQLQARRLPLVAPRSLFSHRPAERSWVAEELDGLDVGHVWLERRFAQMLEGRWAHPDWSFYTSFGSQQAGKAAYDFLVNRRGQLHFENLLAPHQHQTRRRMAAESVVLLAQDTTTLSYNTLKATQGLGDIADEAKPGRGLFLHTLQAFRLDRIHLGCAWAKLWARPALSDTDQRNAQSIDQKESVRWVEAFAVASQMARQMPQTTLLVAGDRESDIMDLYDRGTVAPPNLFFLVRGQHDRVLENGQKLWDYLPRLPVGGTMSVNIPRNQERLARQATLALRWAPVALRPPRVGCKNSWGTLSLWALMATEVNPPAGAEPIEWLLLTNWPIKDLKTARRLVRWYGLRWGIECWHQVLKDVCRVEKRQMKTAEALGRALVLDMIVAWRVLLTCRLGQAHPHLPAGLLYSPEELAILEVIKKNTLVRNLARARKPVGPERGDFAGTGGGRAADLPAVHSGALPGFAHDSFPSQRAGGMAGRVLGATVRWPSGAENAQAGLDAPPPIRAVGKIKADRKPPAQTTFQAPPPTGVAAVNHKPAAAPQQIMKSITQWTNV